MDLPTLFMMAEQIGQPIGALIQRAEADSQYDPSNDAAGLVEAAAPRLLQTFNEPARRVLIPLLDAMANKLAGEPVSAQPEH